MQHLLGHVLRLLAIVHDAQSEVVDGRRIGGVQGLERLGRARAEAGDQPRLVGEASRDVRLWLPRLDLLTPPLQTPALIKTLAPGL